MNLAKTHVSATLFVCFSVVQLSAYFRGLQISCGCFGPVHSQEITPYSIATTIILGIVAAIGLHLELKYPSRSEIGMK